MADIGQTEWLLDWWNEVKLERYERYALLKVATQANFADHAKGEFPDNRLWLVRRVFNRASRRYPLGDECFLCKDAYTRVEGRFLVRHHIVSLRHFGTNRRLNIVILCNHCHAYMHPWLFKDLPENREKPQEVVTLFKTQCCEAVFMDSCPVRWNAQKGIVECSLCGHRYNPVKYPHS